MTRNFVKVYFLFGENVSYTNYYNKEKKREIIFKDVL